MSILKYSDALTKAACADGAMTISGLVIRRRRLSWSRDALTAVKIDSVPPDVIDPQISGAGVVDDVALPPTKLAVI